ncbi:hypothetical protein V7S79_04850 [Aquirufa sp. ROCK-SH2]
MKIRKIPTFAQMKLNCLAFLVFVCTLGQISCSAPESNGNNNTYYHWEKFLNSAIKELEAHPKMVQKTIFLQDKKEEKVFKTMDWQKEWAVFMEADLNKPAYLLSYDNLSEDGLIWYSAKIGEKVPVKTFKMHLDAVGKPLQVEIIMSQSNFLFETSKKLNMNIIDGRVETYSIDGYQKIRFLPATTYKLMGVLL